MKITPKTINRAATNNNKIVGGDGSTVSRMGQNVCIQGGGKGPIAIPGSSIVAFAFVEEFDNWITAKRYNWATAEESETLTCIAKAPQLRRDFYENFNDDDPPVQEPIEYPDGKQYLYEYVSESERKCTDTNDINGYYENQKITPSYCVGEVVYAMTAQTGLQNDEGANIAWVDMSTRMWARSN